MKFRHIDEIHKFFAGGAVGAFLAGIGTAVRAKEIDTESVILAFICMIIRFKFWIDDREYFMKVESGKFPNEIGFQIGVVVGIASWMPWIVAGLVVSNERVCSGIMVSVFVLSAIWMLCTLIDRSLSRKQIRWLYTNGFYTILFFALSANKAHVFPNPNQRQALAFAIEFALVVVVMVDAYKSDTLIAVSRFIDSDSN